MFYKASARRRARGWATVGVVYILYPTCNNQLEEMHGTLTKCTFQMLLISNHGIGCYPIFAHLLVLPLALHNLTIVTYNAQGYKLSLF